MDWITKLRELIGKLLDQTITKSMSDDDIKAVLEIASMLSGVQAVSAFIKLPFISQFMRNQKMVTKYAAIVAFLCQCVLDYRNTSIQY